MRTYLVVALFVVSVPAVAHAGDSDPSSASADDCCRTAVYASDENQADDVAEAVGADVLFSGEPTYGVYLAPAFETSRVADQGGVFFGGRGGLIISDVLTIGGGINWLLDGPRAAVDGLPAIRMRHGGGLIGLTLASDQIIHPTIDLLIGGGRIAYDYDPTLLSDERANVFVLDFSTGFDLNITHGIRAHVGGGYRHVSNFALEGLTDEEVDGFFAGVQLKFGTF
ncbi:MAG: hypothetical protein ABEN55_23405 [Bradymonadaceae bacterium]